MCTACKMFDLYQETHWDIGWYSGRSTEFGILRP